MQNESVVSIIVTKTPSGVIGQKDSLPWKIPSDFGRFKTITNGHPVIMGHHTCAAMLKRNGIGLLLGRHIIVLSRNVTFRGPMLELASSAEKVLDLAEGDSGADEIFVIGGADIYRQFLPLAQKIYITEVCAPVEGDAFFPPTHPYEWRCSYQSLTRKFDSRDQYSTRFTILERVSGLAHD